MDAEMEARKVALLAECQVDSRVFEQVLPRLESFMEPFVDSLVRREQCEHAVKFVCGLLSDLEHKNVESIAYRFGEERLPLQCFIGTSEWDDEPLRDELVRQVAAEIGDPDAVLVFDPSAFPKSGRESVGVARQWCGRLGKLDNCQVGVDAARSPRWIQRTADGGDRQTPRRGPCSQTPSGSRRSAGRDP